MFGSAGESEAEMNQSLENCFLSVVAVLTTAVVLSVSAPLFDAGISCADDSTPFLLKATSWDFIGGSGSLIAAEPTGPNPPGTQPNSSGTPESGNPPNPVAPRPEDPEKKAEDLAEGGPGAKVPSPSSGHGDMVPGAASQTVKPSGTDPGDDTAGLLKQAAELTKNGAHSESLSRYEAVIKKASGSGSQKVLAEALNGAARNLHELGKDQEALEYINRSIAINQSLKNARARSLDYIQAGRIFVALADYSQALSSFREAAKILPASEASEIPSLSEATAECLLRLNHHSEALAELNRGLSLRVKDGNDAEAARLHLVIGDVYVSRSDYKSARINFKKAEQLCRHLRRDEDVGRTLFRIAYLDLMTGDLKSAQKSVEEGQSFLRGKGDPEIDALPLLVKGLDAHNRGMVIQALRDVSGALNRYERAGDRMMAARARLALANVQMDRSNLKSALELGGTALTEFRNLSAPGGEAASLTLVGEVYFRQGYVHKALEYAQEALTLSKKAGDRNQMVQSRILLAEIHGTLGDAPTAARSLKEALEDEGSGANRRTQAQLKLAVARFRFSRESLDKAFQDTELARKDFLEMNDRRGAADCALLMGMLHELRGEQEKALEMLQQALSEHTAVWDRFGEGRDLTALGVHSKNLGDLDKALEYFNKALDLRKSIGDRRGYAANLSNRGNLLRHRNEIPEALKNLEEALAVYRELADKKGEADVLTSLGHLEMSRGAHRVALDQFTAGLKLHRDLQDNRGVATDLAGLGGVHLAQGDLENASASLEEATRISRRIRNPRGEVAILADLAMVQRAKRNPSGALTTLTKALELARHSNDARAVSSIHLKMATMLEDAGEYTKALNLLRETLTDLRQQGDRKGELSAVGSIGVIQLKTAEYESALRNLKSALQIRTELGLFASQSRELEFHLGEIYEGFRDFEHALDYYQKALSLAQTPGNDAALGRIYDRIGNVYYKTAEYAKAMDFLEDALRVHSDLRDIVMQKSALIRLGDISSKLGKPEAALKYQQKALVLTQESNDPPTEARILTRIATLHQMMGRPRFAIDLYKEALEIRTKLGDRRGVNENLLQIALVTSTQGDFDSAVADLKRAFEISQCSEDRGMIWKAYFIMGSALETQQRSGEALESYRKALTILEAMEADTVEESDEDDFIFGGKTALFEKTLRVLMKLAKKDPEGAYDNQALRIVEKLKALAFEETLSRMNVDAFSDLPQELLIKEKSLRFGLRQLNDRLESERSKVNPNQEELRKLLEERRAKEKSFTELKERLMKEYPAYAELKYPRPVSVHQLRREVLDPDETVLEYMVTRSRTYLFALDKHRFQTFSIEYTLKDMEKDVEVLTKPLHRADTQASWDPSVAYRLYSRLIKPAEYFLVGKKAVIIVPHGPLSSLPFQILVDSEAHATKRFWSASERPSYLLERYAFCYAPSLSVLSHVRTRKRSEKPGWNLVAFGDAVYTDTEKKKELNPGADRLMAAMSVTPGGSRGGELRPLPGARKEISEIVKIMGGSTQTYLGPQATETLFKKAALSRYAYVHLATHGVLLTGGGKFQAQPAIIFSLYGDSENDGFLQLGEVFGLKLNAELVVLSSCLTPGDGSQGENNGLLGLARAFLFAGTDSVILSMWQVHDDSTAKLFIDMYRNLKSLSKAEALREAQLSLLSNPGTCHPYYWAPFILMGNWQVKFHPLLNRSDTEQERFKGVSVWSKLLGR